MNMIVNRSLIIEYAINNDDMPQRQGFISKSRGEEEKKEEGNWKKKEECDNETLPLLHRVPAVLTKEWLLEKTSMQMKINCGRVI